MGRCSCIYLCILLLSLFGTTVFSINVSNGNVTSSSVAEKGPSPSMFACASSFLLGSKNFQAFSGSKKPGEKGYCCYLFTNRLASYPFLTILPHQLIEADKADTEDKYVPSEGIKCSCLSRLNVLQVPPLNFAGITDCSSMTIPQFFQIIDAGLMGMLSDQCINSLSKELINHLTPYLLEKMVEQRPSALLAHWAAVSPTTLVRTNFLYSSVLPREENADSCCILMPSDFGNCLKLSVASTQCLSKLFTGADRCKNLPSNFFDISNRWGGFGEPMAIEDSQLQRYLKEGKSSSIFKEVFSKKLPHVSSGDVAQEELKPLMPFRIISTMDLDCFDAIPKETKTNLWKSYREYFRVANSGIFERRANHMDALALLNSDLRSMCGRINNWAPISEDAYLKDESRTSFSIRPEVWTIPPFIAICLLVQVIPYFI